jgi:hypothetical protein
MRARQPLTFALVSLLALAVGCSPDGETPLAPATSPEALPDQPTSLEELVPLRHDIGSLVADRAHWADGYVWGNDPTTASYAPSPVYSFNRLGNPITVTKPAGTTGRYLVRFGGLSSFLGNRSTVRVTGYFGDNTYCKPAGPALVNNQVEVRCFRMGTGAAANAVFTALVTRNYGDLAFAHASQPTAASYAPPAAQSWNPGGAINVTRSGVGSYLVTFTDLGTLTSLANGGHVEVSAVGTSSAHCKVQNWTGSPNLVVNVRCFSSAGAGIDSKFNVLFLLPAPRLAYVWADQPVAGSYSPNPNYRFNPSGAPVVISRTATGSYTVTWQGADPQIIDGGDVQVTAYGAGNAQCKVERWTGDNAFIRCFGPTGAPMDSQFTALYGS